MGKYKIGPLATKTQVVIWRKYMAQKEHYYILCSILKSLSRSEYLSVPPTQNQLNDSFMKNFNVE